MSSQESLAVSKTATREPVRAPRSLLSRKVAARLLADSTPRLAPRQEASMHKRGITGLWSGDWSAICRSCCRSLPLPRHLWKKMRTTNVIERCFVEVRRRTCPMVCFVNVQDVDRIICSIFQRFNLEWKNRTLNLFYTSGLTSPVKHCV